MKILLILLISYSLFAFSDKDYLTIAESIGEKKSFYMKKENLKFRNSSYNNELLYLLKDKKIKEALNLLKEASSKGYTAASAIGLFLRLNAIPYSQDTRKTYDNFFADQLVEKNICLGYVTKAELLAKYDNFSEAYNLLKLSNRVCSVERNKLLYRRYLKIRMLVKYRAGE